MAFIPSNNKAKKRLETHKNAIKSLSGRKVEAGWFESARYKAGPRVNPDQVGMSIAQVARFNEFGTSRIVTSEDGKTETVEHTPARPFMRFAYVKFEAKRTEVQAKIGAKIIDGKISAEQGLAQIGLAMEGEIVDSIKNGPWPPNAPSTVKAKGFNAPLRDTKQMFKSVSSKVS